MKIKPEHLTQLVFTKQEAEAAMCIWEYVLLRNAETATTSSIGQIIATQGASEVRMKCLALAPQCEAAYQAMLAGGNEDEINNCDPFDWEFVPMWCEANEALFR
jgi:hypothetical protein